MATFIALINFTHQGETHAKDSPQRADAFRSKAEKLGCKVKDIFWTLGSYDGVLVLEAPDDESAAAALLSLDALGNVRTQTLRAFSAAEIKAVVARAFGG